jgi:5S rRNA maturation endonuclease (ribonuclease M5)
VVASFLKSNYNKNTRKDVVTLRIRGINVDVNIRFELEQYNFHKARWLSDKLIASSPFRYYADNRPSFFVCLDENSDYYGVWKDSGAIDPEWTSGGFVKLLSFLRGEDYESTIEYLLATYASDWDGNPDSLTLDTSGFDVKANRQRIDSDILNAYKFRHPYFGKRGISERVQREYGVGYDKRSRAVTLPWFNADGTLANVKYRKVDSKIFWYLSSAKNAVPIARLLYGIDVIYKKRAKIAAIVEGESDVLSFSEAGIPAIGIGGSAFTDYKADLIVRSPIERLIIATDNDRIGRKIRDDIVAKLAGKIELTEITWPDRYKDANDVLVNGEGTEELRTYVEQAKNIGFEIFTLKM